MNDEQQSPKLHCSTCRHFTYQPCFVAGKLEMSEHYAKWYRCFPDATDCRDYEREPGSDDD